MIKTHTFNGVKFSVDIDPRGLDGECESPISQDTKPTIGIYVDLKTRKGLITALHESLHAADYRQTEEVVERVAEEVGKFLWRLGYRIKGSS